MTCARPPRRLTSRRRRPRSVVPRSTRDAARARCCACTSSASSRRRPSRATCAASCTARCTCRSARRRARSARSLPLRRDDYILSTHRGHGHCIAKGADPARMLAEFFGKETGYCKGRGGSMHIADVEGGNLGANGIVAGGLPIAVGVGMSIRAQKQDRVCMVFFGDGATNEGAFHEALNMASIWKLPVVFVCENNKYGMSMDIAQRDGGGERRRPRVGVRDARRLGRRQRPAARWSRRARQRSTRARAAAAPRWSSAAPTASAATRRATATSIAPRRRSRSWRGADPIARLEHELVALGVIERRRGRGDRRRGGARPSTRRSSSRRRAPTPTRRS